MNEFKIGDVVCLTFDKNKRFLVTNNVIINNEIEVSYFNERITCKGKVGKIVKTTITVSILRRLTPEEE